MRNKCTTCTCFFSHMLQVSNLNHCTDFLQSSTTLNSQHRRGKTNNSSPLTFWIRWNSTWDSVQLIKTDSHSGYTTFIHIRFSSVKQQTLSILNCLPSINFGITNSKLEDKFQNHFLLAINEGILLFFVFIRYPQKNSFFLAMGTTSLSLWKLPAADCIYLFD